MKYDGKRIISDSDQGIALDKVPGSMVVIGGRAIGLELGSVWMPSLGSKGHRPGDAPGGSWPVPTTKWPAAWKRS